MKKCSVRSVVLGAFAGGCALGVTLTPRASAVVSDEDFNALKDLVTQQGQKLEQLEQVHNQDQKIHQQDQQQIQQLQQQILQTQSLATNAVVKAEAASQIQPVYPAPNPAPKATHNFIVTGDAEVQYGKAAGQNGAFSLADFAPIFLFRANDNILFEAGFDVTLQNNVDDNGNPTGGSSTAVDLSFAQLDYLLNDYVTLVAGDMLLPLGTYSERAAGWLNKIPDDPLARDLVPGSGIGAQLRGSVPVGEDGQMVTYSVYGANGPSSSSLGSASASEVDLEGNVGDTPNWHSNPSGGGRIGWFYPWGLHDDLELGVSGQTGEWTSSGQLWSAAVLDAAVHLGPYFEAKGEYINTFVQTDDQGNINPNGLWVQASYKLAGLQRNLPIINDLELVSRYDYENDDGQFGGGAGATKTDRYTAGYVYYFTNTLLFEGDYEWFCVHGPNPDGLPPSQFVFQLSYGF
jgi:hypothetical protein